MSAIDSAASTNGRGHGAWAASWMHLSVERRSRSSCRVTFDHPPINAITATTVAELGELVDLIEQDPDLNVVVFDSANPHVYLADYDAEDDPSRTAALGAGPTGLPAWLDVLVRLPRAPVVSVASIRGRTRGAGSEFVLACDLRLASRENVGLGGRAPEILLVADDQLDARVEALASRLAGLEHDTIARAKSRGTGLMELLADA